MGLLFCSLCPDGPLSRSLVLLMVAFAGASGILVVHYTLCQEPLSKGATKKVALFLPWPGHHQLTQTIVTGIELPLGIQDPKAPKSTAAHIPHMRQKAICTETTHLLSDVYL